MTDFGLTFILIMHTEWVATSTTDGLQMYYRYSTMSELWRGGGTARKYVRTHPVTRNVNEPGGDQEVPLRV
jgi:hypothetical protein